MPIFGKKLKTIDIKIEGMCCEHCIKSVTEALNVLPDIKKVKVSMGKAQIQFDGDAPNMELVSRAVEDAGYSVIK